MNEVLIIQLGIYNQQNCVLCLVIMESVGLLCQTVQEGNKCQESPSGNNIMYLSRLSWYRDNDGIKVKTIIICVALYFCAITSSPDT